MNLLPLLSRMGLSEPFSKSESSEIAGKLEAFAGQKIYPQSIIVLDGVLFCLSRAGMTRKLVLIYKEIIGFSIAASFHGKTQRQQLEDEEILIKTCPLNHENAVAIREYFRFTRPRLLGIQRSIGCGDRLGLATPGHVQAVKGSKIMPVLAQQSIREMKRTQRTPENVLDDVLWGVFQEGYRDGFGADADHLKTREEIELMFRAGFTLFTIDPGDYLDPQADSDDARTLEQKVRLVRWRDLECSYEDCLAEYAGRTIKIDSDLQLEITREALIRAAVKYGNAIAHTAQLSQYLNSLAGYRPYELEISFDETATPTSVVEHFFIAAELKRLRVHWMSLAPRFVGEFEKGVDFKGDVTEFEQQFLLHLKISRYLGPYKLSLHTGSDKFSIYPIFAKHAGDLMHVKTAGTSYLEALHTIAHAKPALFREILDFAFAHFATDVVSYHVSAELDLVPRPTKLSDADLVRLLQNNHVRQLLHVTFGSVLTERNSAGDFRFQERIRHTLIEHEDLHSQLVASHLKRHVALLDV